MLSAEYVCSLVLLLSKATMERGHSSLKLLIGALLLSAVFAEVTDKDVVKARVESCSG